MLMVKLKMLILSGMFENQTLLIKNVAHRCCLASIQCVTPSPPLTTVMGTFSIDCSLNMYSVLVSMQQKWLRLDLCPRTLNNNNNKMTSNELYIFF